MQIRKAGGEGALAVWHLLPLTVFTGPFVWLPVHYQKDGHFSPSPGNKEYCSWNTFIIFKDKYTRKTMAVVTVRFLPIE